MTAFKILLVEDFPTWQRILRDNIRDALQQAGYAGDIRTIGTYDDARDLLESEQWHLLVTDIGLGDPSTSLQNLGIRLVQQAQTRKIAAIAVSGTPHLEPHDVRTVLIEAGARDFFSKQRFDDIKFIKVVQDLLQSAERETSQSTFLSAAPIKVLILAASAKTLRPRLEQEVRDIAEGLRLAQKRDQFVLEQRWAVQIRDIGRAILAIKPHIVHFCGYEGEAGLAFESEAGQIEPMSSSGLSGLFELFANEVKCVVLNGCCSTNQAEAIAQHIPCVVAASHRLGDNNLTEFAVGFYDALGANRPIEFAHQFGCSALQLGADEEHLLPRLIKLCP